MELLWVLSVYGEMTFMERIISLKLLLFFLKVGGSGIVSGQTERKEHQVRFP